MSGDKKGETCLDTGICINHNLEVERRKTDRKDIVDLKAYVEKLFNRWDNEIPPMKIKVFSVFVTLGLLSLICLGAYTFTAISNAHFEVAIAALDTRTNNKIDSVKNGSDRGEEILLAKINTVEKDLRADQTEIMSKVVVLLTSDAEQRQWQKGMMKQLEMLNSYLRDMVNNRVLHPSLKEIDPDKVPDPRGYRGVN